MIVYDSYRYKLTQEGALFLLEDKQAWRTYLLTSTDVYPLNLLNRPVAV